MRRILIEAEKLKNLNSGLGQYCFHLGSSLSKKHDPSLDLCFYVPSSHVGIFGNENRYLKESKWHRLFRLQNSFDIWHCTHQESRYLPSSSKTKVIVTIHDLNFLHTGKGSLKIKHRLSKIQKLINRAAAVTTISNYSASEIQNHLRIPDIPFKVIYNGNSLSIDQEEKKPDFIKKGNFFFSLGIISPKKNFHTLIPVLEKLKDYYLVIAGINTHSYAKEIIELAESTGVRDKVILPGPISEKEKVWLYKNCSAFLFPSIAEGFGLPVVEAMSMGKPVFISDQTSLPEIGGEAAFYFRTFDPEHMAATIIQGINEYELSEERKKKLTEQAAKFSWDIAAAQYAQLYLNL